MPMLLGTIVYACVNSIILALMAIGFNLTFGISGMANFAFRKDGVGALVEGAACDGRRRL